jgi:hypothetical protein
VEGGEADLPVDLIATALETYECDDAELDNSSVDVDIYGEIYVVHRRQ